MNPIKRLSRKISNKKIFKGYRKFRYRPPGRDPIILNDDWVLHLKVSLSIEETQEIINGNKLKTNIAI